MRARIVTTRPLLHVRLFPSHPRGGAAHRGQAATPATAASAPKTILAEVLGPVEPAVGPRPQSRQDRRWVVG